MKKTQNIIDPMKQQTGSEDENNLPGYPVYPESEDIYSNYLEEKDINPEDISKIKEFPADYSDRIRNEKDFNDHLAGSELDIPGSELDDYMENIGSEDEENNYYSLGGDNHDNLEEDQGE